MRPNGLQELVIRYGTPWASKEDAERFERRHMALWHSKTWEARARLDWPSSAPFKRIYCNLDLIPTLDKTFKYLLESDRFKEIKSFDGCWNIRMKRGNPKQPSVHAFGLAVDFNASLMPFGALSLWSEEFLQIMDECGWILGVDFSNKDPMHFQAVEGY